MCWSFFFFFQAEDGIRDHCVTGVQTCALPICLTLRSGTFDPDAEAVLAWCLREAVTNVIRHSRARHCWIRLTERMGELSLEVTDDGRGFAGHDPGTPDTPDSPRGSGLHGVSERLSAVGGRLS